MKKSIQQFINQTVREYWDEFRLATKEADIIHEERLASCSAWVQTYEDIDGNGTRL